MGVFENHGRLFGGASRITADVLPQSHGGRSDGGGGYFGIEHAESIACLFAAGRFKNASSGRSIQSQRTRFIVGVLVESSQWRIQSLYLFQVLIP